MSNYIDRNAMPSLPECEECMAVLTPENDPLEFLVAPGGEHVRVCVNCLNFLQSYGEAE